MFNKKKKKSFFTMINTLEKEKKALEIKAKDKKFLKDLGKTLALGAACYCSFIFGKEVKKIQVKNALLKVDFIAELGKKVINFGMNSIDDIVGNSIHIYPKK